MLIANALYAAIVTRMSRRRFIPVATAFAIANLFVFFVLMRWMPAAQERTIPCAHIFHLGQRLQSFRHNNVLVVHG